MNCWWGQAIGIATSLVFDAVQMAGQILSVQMGYSLVTIIDPNTKADSTVVATFHQSIAMLIFLRLDVHLWILHAIGDSFGLSASRVRAPSARLSCALP